MFWEELGVQTKLLHGNITDGIYMRNILQTNISKDTFIQNIFLILLKSQNSEVQKLTRHLSTVVQKLNISPKYFAVLKTEDVVAENIITISSTKTEGPIHVNIPGVFAVNDEDTLKTRQVSINNVLNSVEEAICSGTLVGIAHNECMFQRKPLLHQIAEICDIDLTNIADPETKFNEVTFDVSKLVSVSAYLKNVHHIYVPDKHMSSLSLQTVEELQNYLVTPKFEEIKGLKSFYRRVDPDELTATSEMTFLPTLTNNCATRDDEFDATQKYICIVPGVEGLHSRFETLCEGLKLPAIVLQPGLDNPHESITDIAERYAKILLTKTELKDEFYLVAYESGVMIALEMAAILESKGLTGTIFCIGGSPAEVKAYFEDNLAEFDADDVLKLAVAKYVHSLMKNENTENSEFKLENSWTWEEIIVKCLQDLRGHILYSNQYAKKIIEATYARIVQVRQYKPQVCTLTSNIVYLTPKYSFNKTNLSFNLFQHSKNVVVTYDLETPLTSAADDPRCAAIINRHLDTNVIDAFRKQNLCETYLENKYLFLTKSQN